MKFSAKLKGQTDVTITPQVSGQLMKICVTEGDQVKKGQVLFMIDSRSARLDLESAQANLQATIAQENSAKLEYESNKNLFEKKIVSQYTLTSSENSYKQAQASVAYVGTHELMDNGKAQYLEVLTAQESLLSAQLNEASNMYNGAQAIIALYIALGGGTRLEVRDPSLTRREW